MLILMTEKEFVQRTPKNGCIAMALKTRISWAFAVYIDVFGYTERIKLRLFGVYETPRCVPSSSIHDRAH